LQLQSEIASDQMIYLLIAIDINECIRLSLDVYKKHLKARYQSVTNSPH